MRTFWNRSLLGLALLLPVTGITLAQEDADDNRPRTERQNDDGARDDRSDRANDDDRENVREDRGNRDNQRNDVREPRPIRSERGTIRDDVNVRQDAGSPSDLDATPAPIQPQPMQHGRQPVAYGNNCCCGNQGVAYNHSGAYQAARPMNGGYRSFSYQGGDAYAAPAPAPVVYNDGFDRGYVGGRGFRGGIQNGANWNRFDEHDSRNLSGSYGSRASLRSR